MKIENIISSTINASLSIAVRQMHAILIVSIFTLSMVLIPWGAAHAVDTVTPLKGDAVKWHPGHYVSILPWGQDNPKYLAEVYDELSSTPAIQGVKIRYTWAELEPVEGQYDFTSIEKRLKELAARKKYLIIQLQTKTFLNEIESVPNYLKAKKYEGGIFAFSRHDGNRIQGYNIKLWNPLVHDRLAALVRALGVRFNSHPNFEGIGMTETAFGNSLTPVSSDQEYGFYYNLLSINKQMRKHFPNTMTYQFTNYPRSILASFVNDLGEMGTGLGGPDTFLEEEGLHFEEKPNSPQGIYNYYPELSGIVPLTPAVEHSNYINTRSDGKGYEPSISELLHFARYTLKANYIFWARTPEFYPEVLRVLSWKNQANESAGGLDPTCPSAYPSCIRW